MTSPSAALTLIATLFTGSQAAAQEASCTIAGVIAAGQQPLPGVSIVVTSDQGQAMASSSGVDGRYRLSVPAPGRYSVRADLPAFAPVEREVVVGPSCAAEADFSLVLQSRVTAPETPPVEARSPRAATPARDPPAPRRARRAPFERLEVAADRPLLLEPALVEDFSNPDRGADDDALPLPPGFSPEAAVETVTAFGRADQLSGMPTLLLAEGRLFGEGDGDGPRFQSPGFGGAFGGPGGILVGGGPGFPGGGFGLFGANRIRGSVAYTVGGSALDADPYPLSGTHDPADDYLTQRFSGSAGGPLRIPGIFEGGRRTSFFLNYSGNHSSELFDAFSTVPTLAMRAGDFGSLSVPLLDPASGRPFADNVIPGTRIDPAARVLLDFIPLPNAPGDRLNYRFTTGAVTHSDNINLRVIQRFGDLAPPRRGPRGAGGGPALNVNVNFRHLRADTPNAFDTLSGTRRQHAWNVPVGMAFSKWGTFHALRVRFNRNHTRALNRFAFVRDVAGEAGLAGIAADPSAWGVPTLSFASVSDLRDVGPSWRVDQSVEIGHSIVKPAGRHTWRWGGSYRDVRIDSRSDRSPNGEFVFTGAYSAGVDGFRGEAASGADFADFLLGLAQQATVQFGPGVIALRGRAWNLFVQDDWRLAGGLTLNAGLRYDYVSPFEEGRGRLVNLDVAPDLSAVSLVFPGAQGPFGGVFPEALVNSDRNNLAPRIGMAWRPRPATVVRAGYGVSYTDNVYATVAQRLAAQPPFAVSAVALGTAADPVHISDPLALVQPDDTTNTYAIDPRYRLGVAQIWNLDVQHTIERGLVAGFSYTGTKGTGLDLLRSPNRGPDGLLNEELPPFLWQVSDAESILHSLTLRLRRRFAGGWAVGGTYTLSKSIDNASSIGGGASVVAQNDRDLEAERGLSSFDRRHQGAADVTWELPFGPDRRWVNRDDTWGRLAAGWQVNGRLTLESGTPYTARVLGNAFDVGRGTNGTLRADVTGQRVTLDDPTLDRFFNTSAFALPAPGRFGNVGRNTIPGPGRANVDLGIAKSVGQAGHRVLTLRAEVTNLLNTVQFGTLDTVVNSPTLGRIVSVRPMRTIRIVARFHF
jgi:hypothetical protein